MGAPDHLNELRNQLRVGREAQRVYFRLRTTPALTEAKAQEFACDGTCRAILARRHMFAADVVELAQAWAVLRIAQKLYFQRRGDGELAAARKAEKEFDQRLEPAALAAAIKRQPTLFPVHPTPD